MRAQESSPYYAVPGYLHLARDGGGSGDDGGLARSASFASSDDISAPHDGGGGLLAPSSPCAIHWEWREKICRWCYQVVDNFDFDREVVSVAVSNLDRYLSSRPADGRVFQLAAMTSLHLAIKLYEPRKLSVESVVRLGRGAFAAAHVAAMERSLLEALEWRVHPPTPQAFCRELLRAVPALAGDARLDVEETAQFLVELSVCDGWFVGRAPSTVAVAATLLALDLRGLCGAGAKCRAQFLRGLVEVGMGDVASAEAVGKCYRRLRDVHRAAGFGPDLGEEAPANDENDGAVGNRIPDLARG